MALPWRIYVLRAALDGALQRAVQRGFGFFVFLLGDLALLVFDFELEEFFFQCFEQHRGSWRRRCRRRGDGARQLRCCAGRRCCRHGLGIARTSDARLLVFDPPAVSRATAFLARGYVVGSANQRERRSPR